VTADDLLYRYRLRALALAAELGNVRAACRALGIHPSAYYRWKKTADRHGLELLRPRERRAPRMPNQASPLTEQRVLAFSLAHPGVGPRRIAAELARDRARGVLAAGLRPLPDAEATGLRRDLEAFLGYYNADRTHSGRHTRGRTPEQVLGKAAMWEPRTA
jgi:Helix-turn-helix domain